MCIGLEVLGDGKVDTVDLGFDDAGFNIVGLHYRQIVNTVTGRDHVVLSVGKKDVPREGSFLFF